MSNVPEAQLVEHDASNTKKWVWFPEIKMLMKKLLYIKLLN